MPEYAIYRDNAGQDRRVEVCDRYSAFVLVRDGETVIQAPPNSLTFIDPLPTSPLPAIPASITQPIPSASPSPSTPSESDAAIDVNSTPVMEDFYINQADKTALAKSLAGIGKTYAGRIVDRKPIEGYKSWEHLIEVNNDFSVDWTMVRQDTPYVVIF